jgi:site-specific DNA-methyltransferase (adenine-specific)
LENKTVSIEIRHGENLEILRGLLQATVKLVYIDPPFNTGKMQTLHTGSYADQFDDYLGFLGPRLVEAHRVLTPDGSLFVHVDPRESHYVKVYLDTLFGRASFMNEIIWSYDYGGRSKSRWSAKHDVILWYAKDPKNYCFNYEEIDRIPYMAPGLVGAEKAERGKTPTDVWWNTIVPTNGKERTGYPTQKPLAILERIVRVHSREGDLVLDFFAGSGTTGEAAAKHKRRALLIDQNSEAIAVMTARLRPYMTLPLPSTSTAIGE